MRPTYENPATLDAEREVASLLRARWGCEAMKLPKAYRVDFALTVEQTIKAWAEIKCRGRMYDEMFLSLGKLLEGQRLAEQTGHPFLLVYSFGGRVFWADVSTSKPRITIGGRTDRRDWQDVEPMALFKLSEFRSLDVR